MKPTLRTAAMAHFEAQRQEAYASLQVFFTNPVGVAEHPNFLEEIVKLTKQLAEAEECLECLRASIMDGGE